MTILFANLQAVRGKIAAAARQSGRDPAEVTLLAVSKTWPAAIVREVAEAGQHRFGESYVQEAVPKITALADLDLEWHFIGPLQANKTRPVAEHFAWVHSVDRLKIAQRLSEARGAGRTPLQVCIQVNISGESSKSGVVPDHLQQLAHEVAALPHLKLRGLMAIPEPTQDMLLVHRRFAALRRMKEDLQAQGLDLDTLSIGMSHDMCVAIEEGATLVRVGTAIFGERRVQES